MENTELKSIRENLGLTQTELAEILGVKMNTVYRWESGILNVPKSIGLAMETVKRKEQNGKKVKSKKVKTIFDVAPDLIGSIKSGLPEDLSANKEYLKDLGKNSLGRKQDK